MRKPIRLHLTRILVLMSKSLLHGVILTCLFSGVLLANEGNAQHKSINEVFISLELHQVTVGEALQKIQERTEFKFIYEQDVLSATREHRVTLEVDNESVAKVLKVISGDTRLSFRQMNGSIVVKVSPAVKKIEKPKENMRTLPAKVVSGKVTDANGEALAGASVLIKGTNQGSIADVDGNYALNAEDTDVLVFSYIGFLDFETTVGSRNVIDVVLQEDLASLQEVVVNAGYWDVIEKEKTGNISRVTANEIEKQPVANPLQALQGRVPGVYIQQTTGVPGGGFNIQIRGQNSLRNTPDDNGNLPLYIVNGVPFTSQPLGSPMGGAIVGAGNPLNSLNPADIESIEILKDADATAIYGSRGANGVVLITTKKGKAGKTKVDINVYQGAGKVSNRMDLLNSQQYLEMRNEAFSNDGMDPRASDNDVNGTWDQSNETDWQEELIGGTTNLINAQVSVSGGNQNTQFLIGSGFYRETTVFPGDNAYKKYTTNFNINHTSINNKFNVNLSGNYVVENNNLSFQDLTFAALSLPPVAPAIFDGEGNLNWEEGTWDNPFALLLNEFNSRTSNLIGNAVVSYQVLEGLQIKANMGYTETVLRENGKNPITSLDPFSNENTGTSAFFDKSINTWIIEPMLEYQKAIGSGRLGLIVGTTFQESTSKFQGISATGYSNDALLDNPLAAPNMLLNDFNTTQYRYNAVFGRVNYNWDGKYIVNLTGRRDGSSRFGPNQQFANFGAIGVAWVFSREGFMQNLQFLSFGKLRASYGTTGSDAIGDYGYFELWNPSRFSYDSGIGLFPNNLFNPDFGWEVNRKLEAGLELGFIEDRIFVAASFYRNRSDNQLVGIPLPFTTGFSSILANFPAEVQNTGLEIEINSINIKNEYFTWSTALNITIPRNKLVSFPDIENSSFRNDYAVGRPLGIQKAYRYLGVDPETGLYTVEDVNEDGIINFNDDGQFLEEIGQEYFGGFQNSIKYKGLELDLLFQFVRQTGTNYFGYPVFQNPPGSFTNQPNFVLDRWQEPGDNTDIQQFTQTGTARTAYLNSLRSDNVIDDASFIRLKNMSLSYQFPALMLEKLNLQQLRLYIQSQNLLTFTDYVGLDPENQTNSLPPLRMITLGAQITF